MPRTQSKRPPPHIFELLQAGHAVGPLLTTIASGVHLQEKAAWVKTEQELTAERDGYQQACDESKRHIYEINESFAKGMFPTEGLLKLGEHIRNQLKVAAAQDINERVQDDLDKCVLLENPLRQHC